MKSSRDYNLYAISVCLWLHILSLCLCCDIYIILHFLFIIKKIEIPCLVFGGVLVHQKDVTHYFLVPFFVSVTATLWSRLICSR